jgi:phenylacetate-coenzyme A ligase PaaK-like adenylate-forming protein
MESEKFRKQIFNVGNEEQFNVLAMELFCYQAENVTVYGEFLRLIKCDHRKLNHYLEIPFLPVALFREHIITDQPSPPQLYFSSSGTTGQSRSRHYIADPTLYEECFQNAFRLFYGNPNQYVILGLLPSYIGQGGSSLIYMCEKLIKDSGHPESGFYLYNYDELYQLLNRLKDEGKKIFLLGVTFALLDFFGQYKIDLRGSVIMETGGMKGRGREMIREEVHQIITSATGVDAVHSEYGMTELMSQAYSKGNGQFRCPPWMKVLIRDQHDPFFSLPEGKTGVVHIIDLGNIHSCAFIATQDLGINSKNSYFEIAGRMDSSELRGCNLLVTGG